MRGWSFRAVLAVWTLALVVAAVAATAGIAAAQTARLAWEEAAARAERGAARALEALAEGLDPAAFEAGTGVEIAVRSRAEVEAAFGDSRVALWRAALDRGAGSQGLSAELGAVAVRALPGTPPPGVVEARISAAAIRAPLRRFAYRAAAASAAIAALALLLSLLLARRLAAPVARLTAAAEGLGRGDLATPVPAIEGPGPGALAATLESMRRRLLDTTAELERRRAELEAVLGSVSEGVFAVDRERRIRYLSPSAAALLGVDPAAAVGRFCGDLLRPSPVDGELPCAAACPILQARFRGPVRAIERLSGAGEERAFWLSASPPAADLQVQILRPETAAEAARRARDAVVADLAHELKTPLAAQRASLELLRERLGEGDSAARELALGIETGTLRLERLIENLLESVRIESGELAIRRLPVDLEEVVEEAVGMTSPLLAKRRQRLEIDLPYPLPALAGDPPRLVQVLVNLLANASKFAPEESEIRLGGAVAGGGVEIWVEDGGPGFDPAALPRLAGRFRRGVRPDAEPKEEGSGLGLWIARSIAERHGGELRVNRVAGRTRVGMSLPATESPA